MPLILQIISGADAGKRIVLRDGQLATFGRTAWADFSFPSDMTFADIHFRIEQRGPQWLVLDLQSGRGTWLNDEAVDRAVLQTGHMLRAGATGFRVVVGDELRAAPAGALSAVTQPAPPPAPPLVDWLQQHPRARLSRSATGEAQAAASAEAFAERLHALQAWPDLWRFLAHYLPLQVALSWGVAVLRRAVRTSGEHLSDGDEAAMKAAEAWANTGEEAERARAADAAEALAHETPAAWLAAAAGWSGGSLGPPEATSIPPPPHLPRHAVDVAVTMALASVPVAQRPQTCDEAAGLGRAQLPHG